MKQRIEIRAPHHEGDCSAVLAYWYKSQGDAVAEGEDLVDYETDKATITLSVEVSGTLAEVCVQEDETIKPGQVLGHIETASEGA